MAGERDLATLQRRMAPRLHSETYVFCTFADFEIPAGLQPIATFREAEGLSAIIDKAQVRQRSADFHCEYESHLITMSVHSSLDAVGFIASVSRRLAEAGIPCNVVSAFHHDHIFVPVHDAGKAFALLSNFEGH